MMDYSRYYMPGICAPYDEEKPPIFALTDENGILHCCTHEVLLVPQGWTVHRPDEWLGTSGGFWTLELESEERLKQVGEFLIAEQVVTATRVVDA